MDSITWILRNIYINDIYVCNARKDPITSFRPKYLAKCYHIGKGCKRLYKKLLCEFEYTPNDLFPKQYREDKKFKYIPKNGYPTISLRIPYQHLVSMLCRLSRELDA
jgi:hypothetical protein